LSRREPIINHKSTYYRFRWRPDEVIFFRKAGFHRQRPEFFYPTLIIGFIGKVKSPAVAKKLLKLWGEASAKILRERILLFELQTFMSFVRLWDAISSPGQTPWRQQMDQHECQGLHIVPA
jgi:hypothetical protein